MQEQLRNDNRIFGLDLMRAMAIIMVLFGHFSWIFPYSNGVFKQLLALSGYLGVEIFFVLSGFLIGKILYRSFTGPDFNFKGIVYFLRRRWFRTLPNYFLILMVNIIIALVIGYDTESLWKYFLFLQNFATPMPVFFSESWSLSIEEFAYLILPFSLFIGLRVVNPVNKSRLFFWIVLGLITFFIGTKFAYNLQQPYSTIEQWNEGLKSVVIYRLDAIFIGVFCSWVYCNYEQWWAKMRLFLAFLGFLFVCFFTFGVGWLGLFIDHYPSFWNLVYLPLTSVTVALFLPLLSQWKTTKSVLHLPVTFISLISYAMYLLHYGVVLQIMKHVLLLQFASTGQIIIFALSYLVITVFLSYLLYRFYEKPMMDRREPRNP